MPDCHDSLPPCDKWQVVKLVARVRKVFGLNDRDLAVLEALVSFHPAKMLDIATPLIVHPANATLSDRLNGMPDSTLRRHLARLVGAGLIIRRDSPNGKRFVRRTQAGKLAFGFDLAPLVTSHTMLAEMAAEALAEETALKALRETVVLMRRDLWALGGDHPLLAESGKLLRRNLTRTALEELQHSLHTALLAEETGVNDSQNERHQQNSNQINFESEKQQIVDQSAPCPAQTDNDPENAKTQISLQMVLEACPTLRSCQTDAIRTWHDLERTADQLRPMMQIGTSLWHEAKSVFGATQAAIVLAAILERFDSIRAPGAYLRHLAGQMREGLFSPLPMLMALLRKQSSQM